MKKIKIIMMSLLLTAALGSCAPERVVVSSRPEAPYYERPVAPHPHYVWVEGDWETRNGVYVYRKGYWSAPKGHRTWVAGTWVQSGKGWYWKKGRWS